MGCDGQTALNILQCPKDGIKASSCHSDLKSVIIDLWTSTEITEQRLNILEQMNILVDRLATLTAGTTTQPILSCVVPRMGMDVVQYKNRILCGDLYGTLYNGIIQDRLLDYFSSKLFSSPNITSTIDFPSFTQARKSMYPGMNKFVTKWISNTIATGVVLQRRNHRIFNRCPRCNVWGEDKLHVVVCWDIRAKLIWDKQIEYLKSLMLSLYTHPEIYSFITLGLAKFRAHPNLQEVHQHPEEWQQEQSDIGWLNFLTGFVSTKMVQMQQSHYNTLGLRNKGHHGQQKLLVMDGI